MQGKYARPDELEKVTAAGDTVAGNTPREDDVEGWVKHGLAAYRAERDYHLIRIVRPTVAAHSRRPIFAVPTGFLSDLAVTPCSPVLQFYRYYDSALPAPRIARSRSHFTRWKPDGPD